MLPSTAPGVSSLVHHTRVRQRADLHLAHLTVTDSHTYLDTCDWA